MELIDGNEYEYRNYILSNLEKYTVSYIESKLNYYSKKLEEYNKDLDENINTNENLVQALKSNIFNAGFNMITFKKALKAKNQLFKVNSICKQVGEEGQYKFIL